MRNTAFVKTVFIFFIVGFAGFYGYSNMPKPVQEFYQITVYRFKTADQEKIIDDYLQHALLPALHKINNSKIGVFKPIANDTASEKIIYVFTVLKSYDQVLAIPGLLQKDAAYNTAASAYLDAVYNNPPYTRMESILLKAFTTAPQMQLPVLSGEHKDHIYELRSYESATEKYHINKVSMFNEGGEVPLFKRLNFNAIFYADVISGSRMPNLMYMTSFDNMAARDEHWKAFVADAEWKKLSAMPEYQHNVSRNETILCHAADYSDL